MNCQITGSKVRVLARTVNFFSKISTEVQLEAGPSGLWMRAVNLTNTAYVEANFGRRYFLSFRQGANDQFDENNCRVSVKPLLRVFKSLTKILLCKIWLQLDRMKIVFQFQCKSDVRKTHIISLLEYGEELRRKVGKLPTAEMPNKVVGCRRVFGNILMHFHRSIEEITFGAEPDKIVVTNYIEVGSVMERTAMRTTFSVDSTAFRLYQLKVPSSVTFCYKEFKAMAHYAALNRMAVVMNFGQGGSPILIRLKMDGVVQLNFLMGTMRPRLAPKENRPRLAPKDNWPRLAMVGRQEVVDDSQRIDVCETPCSSCSPTTMQQQQQQQQRQQQQQQQQHIQVNDSGVRDQDDGLPRLEYPARIPSPQASLSSSSLFLVDSSEAFDDDDALLATIDMDVLIASASSAPTSDTRAQATQLCSQPMFSSADDAFAESSWEATHGVVAQLVVPETPEVGARCKHSEQVIRRVLSKCFDPTFDPGMLSGASQTYAEDSDPVGDVGGGCGGVLDV